jgi:glycosyltransferase involved in cell wall biosynthesis
MATLSVVMATFNGARFLQEQLDSLAAQTLQPDEMVICDDGSHDDTVALAERWAKRVLFPVHIHQNTKRLGYRENFLSASRLSTGELISWCDQDDIWNPEKLDRCVAEFEDPGVVFVMHAFECFYPDGTRFQAGPHERAVKGPRAIGISETVGPGFSMVFDRKLMTITDRLGVWLPEDFGEPCFHDQWISFLAPAVGKAAFLPDALAAYRQHDANVRGWQRPSSQTAFSSSRERTTAEMVSGLLTWADKAERRIALLHRIEKAGYEGAAARLSVWQRSRIASLRRMSLYNAPLPAGRMVRLAANAGRGDYAARWRGGLGGRSFIRDVAASVGAV